MPFTPFAKARIDAAVSSILAIRPQMRLDAQAAPQPAPAPAVSTVTRKDFTDRLGLPEDATNDQVLAAYDAAVKPKVAAGGTVLSDEEFYVAVFGDGSTRRSAPVTAEDALYEKMFGA